MVKFDHSIPYDKHIAKEYKKMFPPQDRYIFMGEIKQMPGHCILCQYPKGEMIMGWHTDNFIPVPDDEL